MECFWRGEKISFEIKFWISRAYNSIKRGNLLSLCKNTYTMVLWPTAKIVMKLPVETWKANQFFHGLIELSSQLAYVTRSRTDKQKRGSYEERHRARPTTTRQSLTLLVLKQAWTEKRRARRRAPSIQSLALLFPIHLNNSSSQTSTKKSRPYRRL